MPFNASQQQAFRDALEAWSNIANISFVQVAETSSLVGEIRAGFSSVLSSTDAAAWAYLPSPDPEAGDLWLDPYYPPNQLLDKGGYGYLTLMHEIGHSLGLGHPFESSSKVSKYDNLQYTIMSYTDSAYYRTMAYPVTPMLHDIAAMQYLYGANMNYRTGNDIYSFSSSTSNTTILTIWDAGGTDTLSASNQYLDAIIDSREGSFSSIGPDTLGANAKFNIGIAFGVTIENAQGGLGNDTLVGNSADNLLDGGSGADSMSGGQGNDTYVVDNSNDLANESIKGSGGIDTVLSEISYSLGKNIENLTLQGTGSINGTGNSIGNILIGNDSSNILDGGKGDDVLDGKKGSDLLIGGKGKDTIVFADLFDDGSIDRILDFSVRDDTINLSLSVFDQLPGTGFISVTAFHIGPAAQDADDRIIYDKATGALFYDADGTGLDYTALQFASLSPNLLLTPLDFNVA